MDKFTRQAQIVLNILAVLFLVLYLVYYNFFR